MRKTIIGFVGLFLMAGLGWAKPEFVPLVALPREGIEGMVWEYGTIQLGTQTYSGSLQGIGSPGAAGIMYDLQGNWDVFEAYIGYRKGTSPKRTCKFVVQVDQETLYTSSEIKGGDEPEFVRVPIKGRKQMLVRIEPVSYGGTLGACYGGPVLRRGVPPEEMATPYQIEVNGQKVPYDQFSAPTVLPVNLPVKAGESNFQVKIVHDAEKRQIKVTTTP